MAVCVFTRVQNRCQEIAGGLRLRRLLCEKAAPFRGEPVPPTSFAPPEGMALRRRKY